MSYNTEININKKSIDTNLQKLKDTNKELGVESKKDMRAIKIENINSQLEKLTAQLINAAAEDKRNIEEQLVSLQREFDQVLLNK